MRTNGPAKLGSVEIRIFPGSSQESCFGTLYSGCDFEAEPSMKKAGLKFRELCQFKEYGDLVRAYEVSRLDGGRGYLIESTSGGSGGISTELALVFDGDRARGACKSATALT